MYLRGGGGLLLFCFKDGTGLLLLLVVVALVVALFAAVYLRGGSGGGGGRCRMPLEDGLEDGAGRPCGGVVLVYPPKPPPPPPPPPPPRTTLLGVVESDVLETVFLSPPLGLRYTNSSKCGAGNMRPSLVIPDVERL